MISGQKGNSDLNRFIIKHYSVCTKKRKKKCVQNTPVCLSLLNSQLVSRSQGCFVSPGHSQGKKWATSAVLLMESSMPCCTRFPCTGDCHVTGNPSDVAFECFVYIGVFILNLSFHFYHTNILQISGGIILHRKFDETPFQPVFFFVNVCDREGAHVWVCSCLCIYTCTSIYILQMAEKKEK